jgi:hypothetical protein
VHALCCDVVRFSVDIVRFQRAARKGQVGEFISGCFEELLKLAEGDLPGSIVVEIDMVCARNNHQFLLLAADRFKRIFRKVAGVCLFTGYDKRWDSNFPA